MGDATLAAPGLFVARHEWMSHNARSSAAASDGAIAVAISASRDRRRSPKDAYIKELIS
jgi:hypothetical protein